MSPEVTPLLQAAQRLLPQHLRTAADDLVTTVRVVRAHSGRFAPPDGSSIQGTAMLRWHKNGPGALAYIR